MNNDNVEAESHHQGHQHQGQGHCRQDRAE